MPSKATSTRLKAVVTASVAILLAVAACGEDTTTSAATPAPTTPTASEPTRAEPAKVRVPPVTGLPLRRAITRLTAQGLQVGTVSRRPAAKPRGTVLVQSKRAGSKLTTGMSISLVVAAPLPIMPNTVGDDRAEAKRELRLAGFSVRTTKLQTNSASPRTVIDQTPDGGTRARPGATVTLTIAVEPPPPPPSAEEDDCTSGYSPCLPPASDYDCAGGSGDGPAYADGPIYVTGSDPYGLDADGDGVACE
jgi:resuscitation-promoting factor RpfB